MCSLKHLVACQQQSELQRAQQPFRGGLVPGRFLGGLPHVPYSPLLVCLCFSRGSLRTGESSRRVSHNRLTLQGGNEGEIGRRLSASLMRMQNIPEACVFWCHTAAPRRVGSPTNAPLLA